MLNIKPIFYTVISPIALLVTQIAYCENLVTPIIPKAETSQNIAQNILTKNEKPTDPTTLGNPDKDIVLVLDNSGSMKKNDPEFLAKQAVVTFIKSQKLNNRIAILSFDKVNHLSEPLTFISPRTEKNILSHLETIDYTGEYTDIPAAIERAIYILKNTPASDANQPPRLKAIIFMTDGIVDTGNPLRDIEREKWLRNELVADAVENDIRIFGIAFNEEADFQLIQSLSQQTLGEYYRVFSADSLAQIFTTINLLLNQPAPAIVEEQAISEPTTHEAIITEIQAESQSPTPPLVTLHAEAVTPIQQPPATKTITTNIILITLVALTFILLIIVIHRQKTKRTPTQIACLIDLQRADQRYTIGRKPVLLGRTEGDQKNIYDYIVIEENTIGRRHALIEYQDHNFWLSDQGSINRTYLNNQPIMVKIKLRQNDRIRLHKYEFEFTLPELEGSDKTVIAMPDMPESEGEILDSLPSADVNLSEEDFDIDDVAAEIKSLDIDDIDHNLIDINEDDIIDPSDNPDDDDDEKTRLI